MPRLDGIAATRLLLERHASAARVLMLTTFNQEAYVYDALRAGASGFLLKNAPPRELADAIRIVAAGDALLAPEITRAMIQDYVQRPRPGAATSADPVRPDAAGARGAGASSRVGVPTPRSRPSCSSASPR